VGALAAPELPAAVWEFLKRQRFFGLTIPEAHAGSAFRPRRLGRLRQARLAVAALSAVVLIPNSVGPGELLLAYGTRSRKRRYLPRLARGEEIPASP